MKKLMALLLTLVMVSSLLGGMTVFAAEDGTYEVAVTVTGDKCLSLDGQEIDPWANTKLVYTITDGAVAKQAYLQNDYYRVGYWPTTNEIAGQGSFKYNDGFTGMEIVVPSGIGAYTLEDGTAYEAKAIETLVNKRTSDNVAGDDWSVFRNHSGLGKIIISEGITTVAQGSFAKMNTPDITVVFPSTLTTFGQKMFASKLSSSKTPPKNITLIGKLPAELQTNTFNPDTLVSVDLSQTTGLTTLPEAAFGNAKKLTSIKLPSSITTIEGGAFYPYKNVLTDDMFDDIPGYKIENGAVYTADGATLVSYPDATGDLVLPAGLTTVDASALRDTTITSVDFPETVSTIGAAAFASCESLVSVKTISENVTTLSGTFNGCTALTIINGVSGYYDLSHVKTVGQYLFLGCAGLTGTMKIGLTELKPQLFDGTNLTRVVLTNNYKGNGNNYIFRNEAGEYTMEVISLGKITNTSKGYYSNPVYYPADQAGNFTSSKSYYKGDKVPFGGCIVYVDVDGDNASVEYSTINALEGKKAILAFYKVVDGKEVLVQAQSVEMTGANAIATATVAGVTGATSVKLFTWESLSSGTPLYNAWTEAIAQ